MTGLDMVSGMVVTTAIARSQRATRPTQRQRRAIPDAVDRCASVRVEALDEDAAAALARMFSALADPVRLRLLSHVAAAKGEEVCACDLVEVSGRSQPTVSHHMKLLADAGLVTRDKRGLWVWYRISPQRLDALRAALA